MLMSIATVGAIAIGATPEAAVVVFLFTIGELLENAAAGRRRSVQWRPAADKRPPSSFRSAVQYARPTAA
jgi:cation transport ATPase